MQSIRLMRYENSVVTPTDDAILHDMMMPYNGIIKGVEMEHLGSNQIYVGAGRGMIKGRDFEVEEQTLYVKLSEDAPEPGRIIIRLDLANTDEPISFISQIGTEGQLPELIQEKDCNYTAGIYDIPMATYISEATKITDFAVVYETIQSWKEDILDTREEIEANTNSGKLAGALATKELFDNLGGLSFYEDEDGNKYVVGADSVPKKLGSCDFEITVIATYDNSISDGLYQKKFTYKNGLWTNTDISKDNGSGTAKGWLGINVNDFKLL